MKNKLYVFNPFPWIEGSTFEMIDETHGILTIPEDTDARKRHTEDDCAVSETTTD